MTDSVQPAVPEPSETAIDAAIRAANDHMLAVSRSAWNPDSLIDQDSPIGEMVTQVASKAPRYILGISERDILKIQLAAAYAVDLAPLLAERDALRKLAGVTTDAVQQDVADLLADLGLATHARPVSPHAVLQQEIRPAIAALWERVAELEEDLKAEQMDRDAEWIKNQRPARRLGEPAPEEETA